MAAVGEISCPMCGESIQAADRVCRGCGETVRREESPEAILNRLEREAEASNRAFTLLLTGLFGCVAPYFALYGLRFLLTHREPFPRKWMAIVGTAIHCFWMAILVGGLILAMSAEYE